MLRFHRLCIAFLVALGAWLLACVYASQQSSHLLETVIYTCPILVVLLYGTVVLMMLIYGVATFRSVPEEGAALRADIVEAQTYLRQRGVAVS